MTDKLIHKDDLRKIRAQMPPELPGEALREFVQNYFDRRSAYLDILTENPPPLYLLESSALEERAQGFRNAFQHTLPQTAFYYAMKSNNHPHVAQHLVRSGFGLDVSSGAELETALEAGTDDIIFSGPGKTDDELRLAVTHGEKVTVLMDSFGELSRLEAVAASRGAVIRAGVRLTTTPHGLWRKFGILPENLHEFFEKAGRCPHVLLRGLQFHTSWNLTPDTQSDFIEYLGKILKSLPLLFRQKIEFIDIGGGYWPPQGEWLRFEGTSEGGLKKALGGEDADALTHYRAAAMSISFFAEQLGSAIRKQILSVLDCRICFEPGRWICNDAMHILISVVDKKAHDLVITDAGTNAVGWERFESDYFPLLNLTRPGMNERPCHILGSLCTPHDVWGYAYWGEDIQPGDILMIPTQGAYTYSLRQHFIKPLPTVVTI